jgi:DNA-binding HxlR family transcriptional regulator
LRTFFYDIHLKGCFDVLYCLSHYEELRFNQIRISLGLSKNQCFKCINHLINNEYIDKKVRLRNGMPKTFYSLTNKGKNNQIIIKSIYTNAFSCSQEPGAEIQNL